jgi:hypothetical protein
MDGIDYFEILSGAFIGFSFTLLIQLINWLIKKRKANNLLKLEFPTIQNSLESFTKANELIHNLISNIPIQSFELISNLDELLNLRKSKRLLVYEMISMIRSAENLRLLAIPLLNNSLRESELNLCGNIHNGYLKAAKEPGNKLKKKI